jgi:hypothetical protein
VTRQCLSRECCLLQKRSQSMLEKLYCACGKHTVIFMWGDCMLAQMNRLLVRCKMRFYVELFLLSLVVHCPGSCSALLSR